MGEVTRGECECEEGEECPLSAKQPGDEVLARAPSLSILRPRTKDQRPKGRVTASTPSRPTPPPAAPSNRANRAFVRPCLSLSGLVRPWLPFWRPVLCEPLARPRPATRIRSLQAPTQPCSLSPLALEGSPNCSQGSPRSPQRRGGRQGLARPTFIHTHTRTPCFRPPTVKSSLLRSTSRHPPPQN